MIELYQFEMSHYCEKVRLILDYKGLAYKKVEVTPGVGQFDLYRMAGQRQVPVIKDGNMVVADSTAIAKYLDEKYPDRPVIPTEAKLKAVCLMMEEWADESIGVKARTAFIGAVNKDQGLRKALLPNSTPGFLKDLVGSVPGDVLSMLGMGVGLGPDAVKSAHSSLRQDLEALSLLLLDQPYLIGDQPTMADFAVAGLTMYLKFPAGNYVDIPASLKGRGVPSLVDDPAYRVFWDWRSRLYEEFRMPLAAMPGNTAAGSSPGSGPTPINIE
jgi:glutathione S-transferase